MITSSTETEAVEALWRRMKLEDSFQSVAETFHDLAQIIAAFEMAASLPAEQPEGKDGKKWKQETKPC